MNMLKTIVSILTSMQLMFMQVVVPIAITQSVFGTYAAYAEDTSSVDESHDQFQRDIETASEQERAIENRVEENSNNAVANAGAAVANGISQVFPGMKEGDAGGMIEFIMIMVIGFVAASLFMCEKKSTDIYIAAAGGAVYIIGELMQLMSSTKKFKAESINYKTNANGAPDLDNDQIEAFNKQKAGLAEAKKATENKAKMQKAAGAIWLTAATVGGAGAALNAISNAKCATNIVAHKKALQTAVHTACSATAGTGCTPAIATYNKFGASCYPAAVKNKISFAESKAPMNSEIEFASCTSQMAINKACAANGVPACAFYGTTLLKTCASCAIPTATNTAVSVDQPLEEFFANASEKYLDYKNAPMCKQAQASLGDSNVYLDVATEVFEKVANVIFPVAKANNLMKLFGGLGVGIAIVLILKKKKAIFLNTMLGSAWKRAIAFGLIGTMALTVSKKNKKVAEKMQSRINKIDKILKRFDAFKRTNSAINNAFNRGGNLTSVPLRVGTPIGTDDKPFPCLNNSKEGKCVSTKSAIDQGLANSNLNLPEGVTSMASLAGSTADGVAGQSSLTAGAVDGINTLASNAAKANALNRAMQKKLNQIEKANGKKPTDFDKAANDLLTKMKGSMLKTMQKGNISGRDALAAVSPGTAPSDLGNDVSKDIKKEVAKQSAEATPTGKTASRRNNGFQLDFNEGEGEELKFDEPKEEVGLEGLAEGELEVDDIVQDENVSIFRVISVRYLKSGYPRVLKKIDNSEPQKP
jgi:hypothetical protein